VHGPFNTPAAAHSPPQSQAAGLFTHHKTLASVGRDTTTAARLAAALHMAESALPAQNPRDQATRLRELIASMNGGNR
jgi:hypothetical protein